MAYGDFTKEQLETDFGIRFDADYLFPEIQPIEPSEWLKSAIEKGQKQGFRSEKARSERLVTPILTELAELNNYEITIYSGEQLNTDKSRGLNGECDFIFSWSRIIDYVTAPIFCLTEAEKNDLDKGIIQASAQMIGAKYFNEQKNQPSEIIYGCTTTATQWRFLKLTNTKITFDKKLYFMTNLAELLGILHYIVTSTKSK